MTHIRHRHTDRFTVVGNHLAQHPQLSLAARGLAVYIQSLPDGVKVGIKALAARLPEGEQAVAGALRELETCGYLTRTRVPTTGNRWVTETLWYELPPALAVASGGPPAPEVPREDPERRAATRPGPGVTVAAPVVVSVAVPSGPSVPPAGTQVAAPPPMPAPSADSQAAPSAPRPLPEPDRPDAGRQRVAAEILAGLRRHDARLVLSARDVTRLAPALSVWLERGVERPAVECTLTALLPPERIAHPAALLGHRLTDLLPPPLPALPVAPTPPRFLPLQNCDRCDHAFRGAAPGRCNGCLADDLPAVAGSGVAGRVNP